MSDAAKLADELEKALKLQDSREPQYRAPESETARMLVPRDFPTYANLRLIVTALRSLPSDAVPERETFWLLERSDGKAWVSYTGYSGAFVHTCTDDVWRAGRFQNERHAHEVWRSLDKAERERWKPVEHMFINKVQAALSSEGQEKKSAPPLRASQNNAEREPSSDAARGGADTAALHEGERQCQKCGNPTRGEEALVGGQYWCHPCADAKDDLKNRGIDEANRRYDGSAAQRLAFNAGVKWCLERHEEENRPVAACKERDLLKQAQRIIDRDFPNGQLAIDIRDALRSPPVSAAWQPISTAPKDGNAIECWHKVWKCWVAVKYTDAPCNNACHWREVTYTTEWPEDAFTHWRPASAAPDTEGR